jgi:uncharacterized protein YbjT (DUF2867 family)
MTIAITGATGALGRLVINQLKDKVPAADLVALVRSPAKASDLGVSAREADYSKPESSIRRSQASTRCCSSRPARSAAVPSSTTTSSPRRRTRA